MRLRHPRLTPALTSLALAAALIFQSAPANAAITPPTYLRTIGKPGHAGVYAWGMATAKDGSILVGDYNNYNIKRFSTTGQLLQTLSSHGTGPCQNLQPYGLAVDPNDGSIYLADNNAHEVDKFDASGNCLYTISTAAQFGFYTPRLAVNSLGWLYVVNSHNLPGFHNSVIVYDNQGNFLFSKSFGSANTADGSFNTIRGIAIDANDNVYMADAGNGRIQVFDENLNYIRKFGTPGPGAGQLGADLRGLAIDNTNGWIYASDPQVGQVEKYSLAGQSLGTITIPSPDGSAPGSPRELTVGLDHNLYVADYGNDQVLVYNGALTNIRFFPNPPVPAPNGGFNQPEGVAVNNATGNVYVTDTFNHRIQEFNSTGTFVRTWGSRTVNDANAMSYPRGISVDQSNGNVWMNNTRSGNIKEYTSTGGFVAQYGSEGSGATQFFYARGIWVAPNGNEYVPDSGNLRFKALDRSGTTLWTQPCGAKALSGNFVLLGCTTAVTDAAGNVYTAAPTENALYKFTSTGTLVWKKVFAVGPAAGQLNLPYGVAIRGNNLYVSELQNNRISVFDLNGVFQGTFGSIGTAHGQFMRPTALAIDSAGRLYISDTGNERIEVFQL